MGVEDQKRNHFCFRVLKSCLTRPARKFPNTKTWKSIGTFALLELTVSFSLLAIVNGPVFVVLSGDIKVN